MFQASLRWYIFRLKVCVPQYILFISRIFWEFPPNIETINCKRKVKAEERFMFYFMNFIYKHFLWTRIAYAQKLKTPMRLRLEMIAESDFHAVYIFFNYIYFIRAKIRLCHEF